MTQRTADVERQLMWSKKMIGVFEVLVAARGRIRRGWTQAANARRVDGAIVDSIDSRAVCWCANGAIMRANYELRGSPYAGGFELGRILDEAVGDDYVKWNDVPGRTQSEVIEMFDRAIAIAKSRVCVERVEMRTHSDE